MLSGLHRLSVGTDIGMFEPIFRPGGAGLYNTFHVSLLSQLPCFMYLTPSFLAVPIPICIMEMWHWRRGRHCSTCCSTCRGQQWLDTSHWWRFRSLLLAVCASQASVCSRPNRTFVTLRPTVRKKNCSSFQTARFTDSLEMLCSTPTM